MPAVVGEGVDARGGVDGEEDGGIVVVTGLGAVVAEVGGWVDVQATSTPARIITRIIAIK